MTRPKEIEQAAYDAAMKHTGTDRYVYAYGYLTATVKANYSTPAGIRAVARGLDRAIADKS